MGKKATDKEEEYFNIFNAWLNHKSHKIAEIYDLFDIRNLGSDEDLEKTITSYVITDIEISIISMLKINAWPLQMEFWRPDPLSLSRHIGKNSNRINFAYALSKTWRDSRRKDSNIGVILGDMVIGREEIATDDKPRYRHFVAFYKKDLLMLYSAIYRIEKEFTGMPKEESHEDFIPWKGIYPEHAFDKWGGFNHCKKNGIDALEVMKSDKGNIQYISVTKPLYTKMMVLIYFKDILTRTVKYIDLLDPDMPLVQYTDSTGNERDAIEVFGEEIVSTRPHAIHTMRPSTQRLVYITLAKLACGQKFPTNEPYDPEPVHVCFGSAVK